MPSGKAKEARAYGGPSRYVQGPGEIRNLPRFAAQYGNDVLVLIDGFLIESYREKIRALFNENGMNAWVVEFPGICSQKALNDLIAYCKSLPKIPDTFIGIGGGQTCDLNKAAGATFRKAFINVPSALSTDAPTSTHSVINGEGMNRLMVHYKNADYVVVDTEITVDAPIELFISGIGDALATYVEARASFANNNVCNAGGGDYRPTLCGMAIAKLSYDVLMEKGRDAVLAARNHLRTAAYEDVAEATVLLSGLGFECTGAAIAHALQAGFYVLPKEILHGTGVGYGTLVQLLMENDGEMFREAFSFCDDVGLPVCTADLGLTDENRNEYIEKLVDAVYGKRWNLLNMPFHVSREALIDAIKYLDCYAARNKKRQSPAVVTESNNNA
ncbi:MAG: iron-containing alcohol dehydrogenase [Clostridia bacterium]|nr:iron-containing alcohol dehydrogenase [Clostridia bacterium]